ncbi:MAG: O-antigen ligase family protein, partial [Solirubrobacteraceae bacterium]|nr:O-antigen ligase family protein [Solirubrobacteraceae bacterium]
MSAITTAAAEPSAVAAPGVVPNRWKPLGPALLTLAFASLFAALAFHVGGGLQLGPLTEAEVLIVALGGILGTLAVLTSVETRKPWGLASIGLFTLLVLLTGASIVWAINPAAAWLDANRNFALLAAFIIGASLVRLAPGRWRSMLGGLLLASLVISLYALLTKIFPGTLAENETYGRLREPFGYWNAVGLTAALALPAAVWLGTRREGHAAAAVLAYPLVGVLVVALMLAYSRGSLLAAAVGLAFWLILVPLRLRSATVLIAGVGFGALLGVWAFGQSGLSADRVDLALRSDAGTELGVGLLSMVAVLMIIGLIATWLRERRRWPQRTKQAWGALLLICLALAPIALAAVLATSEKGFGGSISSGWRNLTDPNAEQPRNDPARLTAIGSARARYWRDAITIFKAKPIIGVGAGGYTAARLIVRKDDLEVLQAHGYLVRTASELGAVGLAVTLALLAAWLAGAWRATGPWRGPQRRQWNEERTGMAALAATVIVFGVSSLIDWTWMIPAAAVPALFAAGWLAARGPLGESVTAHDSLRNRLRSGVRNRWRVTSALLVIAIAIVGAYTVTLPQKSINQSDAALEALTSGKNAQAQQLARDAENTNPFSNVPLYTLAGAQTVAGELPAAEATYESAVQRRPSVLAGWIALAQFRLNEQDDPAGAMRDIKAALYLNPRALQAKATFLLAYRAVKRA